MCEVHSMCAKYTYTGYVFRKMCARYIRCVCGIYILGMCLGKCVGGTEDVCVVYIRCVGGV